MASQSATPSSAPAAAAPAAAATRKAAPGFSVPLLYRLFFLLVEPLAALVGAYYAHFSQAEYLRLTHVASAPDPIPLGTTIALSQLANLYLFFAINEALVLRSTSDIRVWKTVLFCLLIGDIGHLYTVKELGVNIYWSVSEWNAIDWGNIPFVYLGASMRLAFLLNVGFGATKKATSTKKET